MRTTLLAFLFANCFCVIADQVEAQPPAVTESTTVENSKTFASIGKRIAVAKAQALENYLGTHPDAEDFPTGLRHLFMCYRDEIEDKNLAIRTLERKYDYLVQNEEQVELKVELRELFECYVGMEDPERALVIIEKLCNVLANGASSDLPAMHENLCSWIYLLTKAKVPQQMAKAKIIVEQVKVELADHADVKGKLQLLAELEGMLNQPRVGDTIDFAFVAIDGTKVDIDDLRGKVVLVDFWATWCGPCIASMPGIKAAYDKFHVKGFDVLGVSLDSADHEEKVKQLIKEKSLPWPQSFEGQGWMHSMAVKFGVNKIPTTFLVGKDGKVIGVDLSESELESRLTELLMVE